MDDLFGIIVIIIGAIISIASSAKKEKEKKAADERRRAAAAARVQVAQKKQTAAPAKPAQMLPPLPVAEAPAQVIAPTVHAHVQPDCDAHDAPGSLGTASAEGKDPCHEDQLRSAHIFAEPAQEEGGLTFDWSGESMVKAFVMQEVLTRPCQRRGR